MAGRVTIIDVAKAAGVSVGTVSNVLNGRTYAMRPETQQRIEQTIEALGFRPSRVARSLVMQRTATIGLILPEVGSPLFLEVLHSLEPAARRAGYSTLISIATSQDDEEQAVNVLLDKQVDGFIMISTATYREPDYLPGLQSAGIPIVLINRAPSYPYFDQINWDSGKGVLAATRHLIALGHRCIAHLQGPEGRLSTSERLQGYRDGLAEAGLPFNPDYVQRGDFTAPEETWRQAVQTLLDLSPRPTALIAADHRTAAVALKTAVAAGLRVPHDMAIIGIDDMPLSHYLVPALTSIRLPIQEAGQLAVELLLRRIGGLCSPPEHIMLDCPLVIRESCGASLARSLER